MQSIGAAYLRPDTLPGVNHVRGVLYQIVINITFSLKVVQICVYNSYTKQHH